MASLPPARVVRGGAAPVHLQLAPRRVPARLVWRLLFGSPLGAIGWFVAAFGLIFVLAFVPQVELTTPDYDREATATVMLVTPTGASENDAPYYRVHYVFTDGAGAVVNGASYTTDPTVRGAHRVEYAAAEPSRSRLDGMRTRPFSWWVLCVLVFPVVGLALAIPQLRTGVLAHRLLRIGVETRGRLVSKVETATTVNDAPVMALTFVYEVDGARHRTVVETLQPARLEDDALEPMLYDPAAPERATTLDHLPGSPRVTADGQLRSTPGFAAHVLICPCVVVAELVIACVLAVR